MNTLQRILKKKRAAGSAAVEFAFILPLLVLMAIPIFDFARVIQANIILINISREGANLASRTSEAPQTIMNALAATAPPLNMGSSGMIYITKVMGNNENGVLRNRILRQDKWLQGSYAPASTLWNCSGGWAADGSCSGIPTDPKNAPLANVMTNQLANGEVIYVVEGFYRANIMFSAMNLGFGITTPELSPNLHAMTIF